MKILILAIFCLINLSLAVPQKKNVNACNALQCSFNYDPICGKAKAGGNRPDITFGSQCVLDKYNCEHNNEQYTQKFKGECPGGAPVRLQ